MKCSTMLGNDIFLLACIDFGIQWVAWVFAAGLKTEKFFDLTGAITFVILVSLSYACQPLTIHKTLQTFAVIIWATRLGIFLFLRVLKTGEDRRFKTVKANSTLFFVYWTVQGIWVLTTLLPTFFFNQSTINPRVVYLCYIGWVLWTLGFLIEVIADYQKSAFRKDPHNENMFVHTGLWSLSRHPNYFGEMMLWWGLFISAGSSLQGLQWLCVFCPFLDCLLIIFVSGIPILEKQALKKYGEDPLYQDYIRRTPMLVPFLKCPKSSCSKVQDDREPI